MQSRLGRLAFVCHMQIEKLAPGVSHAANLCRAFFEAGLVTCKIIALQLAVPRSEKIARMLVRSAWAEVIHHGFECRKRRVAISPDIRSVVFLLTWRKHFKWSLIKITPSASTASRRASTRGRSCTPVCPTTALASSGQSSGWRGQRFSPAGTAAGGRRPSPPPHEPASLRWGCLCR